MDIDSSVIWSKARLAVIDFETTGLVPAKDRIVEIGIAIFEDGKFQNIKGTLINPGFDISEEVQKIHGITNAQLREAPYLKTMIDRFAELVEGCIPVAYNAPFDRGFLFEELKRILKEPEVFEKHLPLAFKKDVVWIDPLVWVRLFYKYMKGKKLTNVCEKLHIEIKDAHRAYGDAKATGELLMFLAERMPEKYEDLIMRQSNLSRAQEESYQKWRRSKGL